MKRQCPICKKMMEQDIIKTCSAAEDWIIKTIRRDHPNWVAGDGSCSKCLAYYQELGKNSQA